MGSSDKNMKNVDNLSNQRILTEKILEGDKS